MTARSRPGPKPSPESRVHLIATRLSASDLKRLEFAASMSGSSASEVLRRAARQFLADAGIPSTITVSMEPATNA